MRPFTHTTPKALIPLGGKPVISRVLELLEPVVSTSRNYYPEEVIFIVSPWMREFEDKFVSAVRRVDWLVKSSVPAVDFIYQSSAEGSAHAVWCAREKISGPLLLIFGDSLVVPEGSFDINSDVVLFTFEVADPSQYGVVVIDEVTGYVSKLVEKPDEPVSKHAITGVYLINNWQKFSELLHELIESGVKEKGEYQITTVLQWMIDAGCRFSVSRVRHWWDTGNLSSFLESVRDVLKHGYVEHQVATSARVIDSEIVPPVFIGEGVVIENSIVGPFVCIEDGARINKSTIQNSVIMKEAVVENSYLDQSIAGPYTMVGNFRGKLFIGDHSKVL